jgi:glyoxylase-like metal-dependent hydrolase (beta-lactamase superfamily II)
VSAYVLVRDGEGAVVDTGVEGSADEIEAVLDTLGLAWNAVGHVILTHRHGDHVGSATDVLNLAGDATGYAGAAEISAISSPRPLVAVADGDDVFGVRIVATPGHTDGHICVFDPNGSILVAGDALNNSTGSLTGSSPQFTADPAAAVASVKKLAELAFETLLVGHGEPILSGADRLVRELAAGL